MNFNVVKAEYLNDYKLKLRFKDGTEGVVDLSSYPNPDNVFKKFLDMDYFKNFRVEYGTLVWGNGELDIAPEHLYKLINGIDVLNGIEQSTA